MRAPAACYLKRKPKTCMSYYGPTFANIESGWYRETSDPNYTVERTRIDAVWNNACDEIVRRYVSSYGTFFTAFEDDMLHEVEDATATDLGGIRYHCYYFATRAWEMQDTRRRWVESDIEANRHLYRCTTCEGRVCLADAHPDLIRRHGIDLQVCRPCDYVLRRYEGLGRSVLERVPSLMRSRTESRQCELCGGSFDLRYDSYAYQSAGLTTVDVLYPNLFARVCPRCSEGALRDYRRGSGKTHLARLYDLFVFTGKVPTQDLGSLMYVCRERETILWLVDMLKQTRSPSGFAEEFGSFFAALVASGILPDGSRKMLIGTMILAKDGHLCLSIPEKEIDDFLSDHGLAHDKEVPYPSCSLRCDWEVFTEPNRRVFVEYFGLMSNRDYARRAQEKIELAQQAGIELVALYPDGDWGSVLLDRFRLTSGST